MVTSEESGTSVVNRGRSRVKGRGGTVREEMYVGRERQEEED